MARLGEFLLEIFVQGSDNMGNETPMLSGKSAKTVQLIYNTICMVILKGFPPIIMHYLAGNRQ